MLVAVTAAPWFRRKKASEPKLPSPTVIHFDVGHSVSSGTVHSRIRYAAMRRLYPDPSSRVGAIHPVRAALRDSCADRSSTYRASRCLLFKSTRKSPSVQKPQVKQATTPRHLIGQFLSESHPRWFVRRACRRRKMILSSCMVAKRLNFPHGEVPYSSKNWPISGARAVRLHLPSTAYTQNLNVRTG